MIINFNFRCVSVKVLHDDLGLLARMEFSRDGEVIERWIRDF